MSIGGLLALFVAVVAAAAALTNAVRRYALKRAIVDVPNERSLHEQPVPRGGGLAIVVTFLTGMLLLAAVGGVPAQWTAALVGGGAAVALVGWLDDRRGVSRRTRALVHFAAAAWALAWLGGLPGLTLGATAISLPVVGTLLAAVGIVWWINLYNFMDGIDGLAGGQAVTVAAAAGMLVLHAGAGPGAAAPAFLLAGAAAGFLVLNWSPARIFMGDVGSGFLGFAFATLAIATENAGVLPLLIWVLLSGVFLFDSTVTLLRRALRGERWYEAHRTHAYQRLVTAGHSHAAVTTGALLLNTALALAAYYALTRGQPAATGALVLLLLGGLYLWIEHLRPMPPARRNDATDAHELADGQPHR